MPFTVRDRTQEFLSSVTAFQEYRATSSSSSPRDNEKQNTQGNGRDIYSTPSQLTIDKSIQIHHLGKNLIESIIDTNDKIEQLISLAKITSNFRDERSKIQSLMLDIKQDIESLNIDIKALDINVNQLFNDTTNNNNNNNNNSMTNGMSNNDYKQHHIELIKIIRYRYAYLAKTFAKACEISTQCLQKQKEERDKYGANRSKKINYRRVPRSRVQRKSPNGNNNNNNDIDNNDNTNDETERLLSNSNNSNSQSQSQLMQFEESSYNEQRAQDAMQVERQLTEIGQMMTKLATMVAEQRETIITINSNIDESQENMEGAISELQKYLGTLTGNRWLMIKVFAILIFFALFFALFIA